ncbi:MAG: hypothetical protein ACK53C_06245, partial [Pseudomonadota bacterium]
MSKDRATDLAERLLALVPEDGTPVGNRALRTRLVEVTGLQVPEDDYVRLRDELVARGVLAKGAGRGGS